MTMSFLLQVIALIISCVGTYFFHRRDPGAAAVLLVFAVFILAALWSTLIGISGL